MQVEAMKPYGMALMDYFKGEQAASITVIRDDGYNDVLPIKAFFRRAEDFEVERTALRMCFGRVLDAGAGAGIHSLFLIAKGLQVTAIDVLTEAVNIMREQGVKDVRQIDIMSIKEEQFDTIIMMGHGIGMVETLNGLDNFLVHSCNLLKPGGQILLTSLDVRVTDRPENLAYHKSHIDKGWYVGEIRMQFKYKDIAGPYFGWLQVDPETLAEHAAAAGWQCSILEKQTDGNYLACLRR